jgi:hypothetical protein
MAPWRFTNTSRRGFASVVMTSSGRAGFGSQSERASAAGTAFAYSGRYEVDGRRVLHHVEVSLNPDICGHTLTREIELIEDRLTLSAHRGPPLE